MSSQPKVSVVVPNYNYGRYLSERIESILRQTFTDYELIILDDGSSDDSVAIIKKYAAQDERIRTKLFAQNGGQTLRLHRLGAELARGEYLHVAESDDSCHPTMLEHLVRVLDENPTVGRVSVPNLALGSDELDERLPALLRERIPTVKAWVRDSTDDLQQISTCNTVPCISSVMVRRSVYLQTSGFDPSYTISGDWKLWWECALYADVAYIDTALNYWRRHDTSVSNVAHWQTRRTLTIEDSRLVLYFIQHPLARERLTDEVLHHIRNVRANTLAYVLLRRVRTPRQLRELLPAYRNLRQIDRRAELRLVRAIWRVGMYKIRYWLTFWQR